MDSHDPSSKGSSNSTISFNDNNSDQITWQGRPLIRPKSAFARAVVMGNEASTGETSRPQEEQLPVASNLTLLLNQGEQHAGERDPRSSADTDEADSASGPAPAATSTPILGSSAPLLSGPPKIFVPLSRHDSEGQVFSSGPPAAMSQSALSLTDRVRR